MGKYRIMKFDGDDSHSYAVFHANDVKGKTSPIFYGEATPIANGMTISLIILSV